ncbi:hypothetical protein LOK49_LG08G00366 [Camellia lanceoleosa]|uniref:Uncharacterized protein n=1 Tax=Camellia lanceoleosa TaxID=1840588 RepID=A0ACC0GM17_9ERIC|nr:hypothetical protein LOK49_LG08G00366 [Camellia lanceoleosa]
MNGGFVGFFIVRILCDNTTVFVFSAYDASRVEIPGVKDDSNEKSIYNVASRTVGVRIQKAVDPEVVALLDDSDLSPFGSDDEDLEEDFVVKANLLDEAEDVEFDKKLNLVENSAVNRKGVDAVDVVDAEIRNLLINLSSTTELLVPATALIYFQIYEPTLSDHYVFLYLC